MTYPIDFLDNVFSDLNINSQLPRQTSYEGRVYQDLTFIGEDLYQLLSQTLPENTSKEDHEFFKESIKIALLTYPFFDEKRHLVELTGVNNKDYVKSNAVNNLFKITPDSAKALCQVITETPEIDGLIIMSIPPISPHSKKAISEETLNKWSQSSFKDETAIIFANELPANRFKLLKIIGGIGFEGAEALIQGLPRLLTKGPINSNDIQIDGLLLTNPIQNEILTSQLDTFWETREPADPTPFHNNEEDPCIIM